MRPLSPTEIETAAAARAATAGAEPSVFCSGTTGNLAQVVYARYEGRTDNYSAYLDSFRSWIADVDTIFQQSAAETGGRRRPRFVTDSSCRVTVQRVVIPVPAGDHDDEETIVDKLKDRGLTRTDRKYVVFVDDDPFCGQSIGRGGNDRPGADNPGNRGPGYGLMGTRCWDALTPAHELMHVLGAVHDSAPHSTGGGHCIDHHDRMCYSDPPNFPPMLNRCPGDHERFFDCNHDDYYTTATPAPGTYLATHWNTADSRFLARGAQSDWGYVHANQPTAASYTPRASRSSNSRGGTNTVARTGVGAYTVRFPGMATTGGVAHVTAYGANPTHCTVKGWGPDGEQESQLVDVRCFAPSGVPADSQFTASYVHARNRYGAFAHLLANQPSTPNYQPDALYSYNSTVSARAANHIQRAGVGTYLVWLPGLGPAAQEDSVGTAIVTAAGTSTGWCRVSGWGPSGADVVAVVHCRDAGGALADTKFTFTYANQLSLLGLNGGRAAYVLADQETAVTYTPDARHQHNSVGETNTVERTGTGAYTVLLSGLKDLAAGREGNVQISVEDQLRKRCQIQAWSPFGDDISVRVRCFAFTGEPADTEFALAYST